MVASGNFLEMYDFQVFGFYAAAIGATFFPKGDAYAQLMLSLATFGAGFLMRPVGAVVLGAYVDRHGRRAGLLMTLGLMAIGTLTIAVTPPFMAIGLAAPLMVLAGRLVQGLSAGVELGGVSVYLSEIASPGRKGFYVAWQSASQQVAVMFAAVLGILLTSQLGEAGVKAWGWRAPFLVGCLLVPFLILMRRRMVESPAYAARTQHPTFAEVWGTVARNWGLMLLGMMMVTMTTVSFYTITSYTPTFGTKELHLSPVATFVVTLCVGLTNLILLPVAGAVSDRIGRTPLLVGATLAALATAYPAMRWLVADPSFAHLLMVELWLAVLFATYNGAMVVHLTEVMPERVRTCGFSVAYSLATALFGGFTPAIATWLIHETGDKAMPGAWLSGAAAMGLVAALALRRRGLSPARAAAA
jgi:MFS family permease